MPGLSVSRETLQRLYSYEMMVSRWNSTINLVSKASLKSLWDRHIADSSQIYSCAQPEAGLWLDLGSGGGFPGVVIAIIAKELSPKLKIVLVESDTRKCVFLRSVIRELGIGARVENSRIEAFELSNVSFLSARALANMNSLCGFAEKFVSRETICFFPKGEFYEKEVAECRKNWNFEHEIVKSRTSDKGKIIVVRSLERVRRGF